MEDTIFKEFKEITKLIDNYQNWYWNSDFDDINLIDDLRLRSNIYETAHSRILYKLLKAGKRYNYPLWQEFCNVLKWGHLKEITSFGPPEKYNIDLLVEGKDVSGNRFAVIIENKVNDAVDQGKQITRYIDTLMDVEKFGEEEIYVIYLTRNNDGKEPSEDSFPLNMKERFKNRYCRISYEKEIRKWIENCKTIWINDFIRSVLIQYGRYINELFEPNKENEKVMKDNIDEWCFDKNSSKKKLSVIDSVINQKKESMVELGKQMDVFFRESVIKKMEMEIEIEGFKVKCDGSINYLWFKIKYLQDYSLKGHLNFRKDYDDGIWFGIELNEKRNEIKQFEGENIKGDDANNIITKFEKYFENKGYHTNDQFQYLCWKESTLDTVVDEISNYCSEIQKIKLENT